jgi:hypothetical protein
MANGGNFCTWNHLSALSGNATVTEGNTQCAFTANYSGIMGTHGVKSGKYYVEFNYAADANFSDGRLFLGWQYVTKNPYYGYLVIDGTNYYFPDRTTWGGFLIRLRNNSQGGFLTNTGTAMASIDNSGLRVSAADTIVQCAIDCDNNLMYWGKNNTWYTTNASGSTESDSNIANITGTTIDSAFQGGYFVPAAWMSGASSGTTVIINAGQDSTFAGTKTAGGNTDANDYGDFIYDPPADYQAICSANLTIGEGVDPAEGKHPAEAFNVIKYTGTGSSNAITGVGFAPDVAWIKNIDAADDHCFFDSTRGVQKLLIPDDQDVEATDADTLTAFGSDGFTVGADDKVNTNTENFVAWCWKANGGTTSTNDSGDIDSTVQTNTDSGFTLGTYTGNGTNSQTVGHGFSSAPKFVVVKGRDTASNWVTWHTNLTSDKVLYWDGNAAEGTLSSGYITSIGATTFTLTDGSSNGNNVNKASDKYVFMAFQEIEGFSRFGTYEGTGAADGPYIYCGFRPRLLWVKDMDNADDWGIFDTVRNTYNPVNSTLRIDTNGAENTGDAGRAIDFYANGFKQRTSNATFNQNGATFIYAAFGDVSFKYNNTF